ncbi:hypothetical protein MBAV_006317 [Candidatus Magnetobacterium bavaricum]|uniref:Uncharacterized protein n=1 Tax=Candidatus Magnetobacterium bavaricum TaxID=29290 RepID=A0A0F3GHX5_9BACT|nr:hypothetical protein MBAV_006317 [Candidatus Magnetobacterium bavaricum]
MDNPHKSAFTAQGPYSPVELLVQGNDRFLSPIIRGTSDYRYPKSSNHTHLQQLVHCSSGHHLLYDIAVEISTGCTGFVVVSLIPIDFYITWVSKLQPPDQSLKDQLTLCCSIFRYTLSPIIFNYSCDGQMTMFGYVCP